MIPFFYDERMTLYLGDCREVLPNILLRGCAIITSPFSQMNPDGADAHRALDAYRGTMKVIDRRNFPISELIDVIRGLDESTIVDPYVGRGTTAIAALTLGKKFIGIDIERQRLFDTMERLNDNIYVWKELDALRAEIAQMKAT